MVSLSHSRFEKYRKQELGKMLDRIHYNTVLSQAFSPCGNFLAASNTCGDVAVYSLTNVLNPSDGSKSNTNGVQHPLHHVRPLEGGNICSLTSTPQFLIAGGVGEIKGQTWESVTGAKKEKPRFKILVPALRERSELTDVNTLQYNEADERLCAGCGDNNIYIFNMDNGKLVRTLSGHTGFIHSINLSANQLVSSSEDGTVKLWDMRQSAATNTIKPFENPRLHRPELGKWVGAAALSDDWLLLCGGGPRLSVWHLRSMEVTTVFPMKDLKGVHVAKFHEDRVFAGGAGPHFYQFSLNGQVYGQIPTSASTVYTVELQETPHRVLSIAGASPYIDICTTFNYLDQKLSFACNNSSAT